MPCRFRCVVQIVFSARYDALAGTGVGAGVVGAGGGGRATEDRSLWLGWGWGAWWWGWRRRVVLVSIVVGVVFGYKALCCICLCGIVCSVEDVSCAVEEVVVQKIRGRVAKAWFCGIVEIIRLVV